jgi:hypothetical protein
LEPFLIILVWDVREGSAITVGVRAKTLSEPIGLGDPSFRSYRVAVNAEDVHELLVVCIRWKQ